MVARLTEWDATGPLNKDKTLLYRFTGTYQDNASFRDFNFNQRMLFAPSITWRPTESTDATLELQVNNQDFMSDFGIPVIGKRPASIPISRSLGDPNTPKSNLNQVQLGSLINHRFNDDWAIHSRFLANFDYGDETFVNPAPAFDATGAFDPKTGMMQRNIFNEINEGEAYSTNLDVTGKFDIGFSKHEVLMGFDFNRAIETYDVKGLWVDQNRALAINIFNPTPYYGIPNSVFDNALTFIQRPGRNRNVFFTQWEGVYFQDQITLWDKLHITGGGRYDWAETGRGRGSSFGQANANVDENIRDDEGFSPRMGILYQPIHEMSLYGNWTTSFGANNAPSDNGATFDPQIGEQFEAGIKTQLFNNRLLATLAYYHLTKDNILVPNNNTDDPYDRIANNQRSQGIELDVTGQITDQLSLIGSYAFTDARVIKDYEGGTAGNKLPNVPEHSGSLWVKYDVNGVDAQEGFSFGVGGVAAGSREGNFSDSFDVGDGFKLPGYVRMDAFAAYKMKVGATKVTTSFNIRNLLDKTYYESTDPDSNVAPALGVAPGVPLTAIGSLRVEY
ncbi:MAG: TonB-dependent siderophore receptor [Methyloglobulus sp.]|nr:TonB-dependent siderophore receptor [Methyloglobulus sp.]